MKQLLGIERLRTLPGVLALALGCASVPLAHGQLPPRIGLDTGSAVLWVGAVPRGSRGTASRPQGYLGVAFHDLSDEQVASLHLRSAHGVEILLVDHDGPAGKAGLRTHDMVLSMNGQPIPNADGLKHMIHEAGPGAQIALEVVRAGRPMSLTLQLADRDEVARDAIQRLTVPDAAQPPPEESAAADPNPDDLTAAGPRQDGMTHGQSFIGSMLHAGPFTGLAMEPLGPQLAGFFGAPEGIGLLVRTVITGSPAARAGLRAGDVVLRADGVTLRSAADWTKRLHASKGRPMLLGVLREKRETSMTLQPEPRRRSALEWPHPWTGVDDVLGGYAQVAVKKLYVVSCRL